MHAIRIQSPALPGPQTPPRQVVLPLAPRLPSLHGQRFVLFDNGKLHRRYGHRAVMSAVLERQLRQNYGIGACWHLRRERLSQQLGLIRALASEIAASGAVGVVLALCDEGTTASTILLAWELERRRLPTVTLCSGQALQLAAALSISVCPGLPLSQLNISQHSSVTDIAVEMIWVVGEIGDALTIPAEQLRAQFSERFAVFDPCLSAEAGGNSVSGRRRPIP